MSDAVVDARRLCDVLKGVAQDLKERAEELRQLDAQLGDGDLGVTVELSCRAMSEYLASTTETDTGRLLTQCGLSVNRLSPSTFGTILATAFLGAGKAATGKTQLTAADLALAGNGAIESIKRRGKAEVGDKTVLDALAPAVQAFEKEWSLGSDIATALNCAVEAAECGMRATAGMQAKFGRARWFQDRSIGIQDAGATAMYFMVESFARNLRLLEAS